MVSNKNIKSFIRDLPKVELHLHLEGAIPLDALLLIIKKYKGADYITLSELKQKFAYTNFAHFIDTWYWKNGFIREYEDYEFIAEQVANDLAEQNISYAEVFFSPSDFRQFEALPQEIATAIRRGFDKHSDKIEIKLIADLVRDPTDKLPQLKKISEVKDQGVVGIGIGGLEKEYPPKLFTKVFTEAKKNGFKTTCHAGEAAGADYIWQAIRDLKVDRIGHGTAAKDDHELVQYLIDNKIPIEMCPISNVRTNVVNKLSDHPIIDFHQKGMIVSVNTDDPKMFHTSLVEEYLSLIDTFDLELLDIYHLALNGIESAWCSEAQKKNLKNELNQYYKNN